MDGQSAGDGAAFVEGHVQSAVLAQVVQHVGKVLRLAGDEAVPHAGGEHQIGEGGNHLLAADLHLHALFLRHADVVAPLLVEARHDLLLGLALHVEAEDVPGLDGLEVLAALLVFKAEALEHVGEGGVGRGDVGVNFDNVGMILLGQRLGAGQQLGEGLPVVEIAHGAAAAVHQRAPHKGHLADHHRQGTLDFPVSSPDGDGLPDPHGLLLAPEVALGEIPLGMGLDKGFIFPQGLLGNQFVHGIRLQIVVMYRYRGVGVAISRPETAAGPNNPNFLL